MLEIIKENAAITLADSLPDTVFLVDTSGTVRYVNSACESTLGYASSDLIGQRILDLVVPEDVNRTLREADKVLAGGKRVGFENRYHHRSGADVHLSWSAQWLSTHRLRIGMARDITALRRSESLALAPVSKAEVLDRLAPYEQRVLKLLLTDAAEKQIAHRLGLADSTTHSYVTAIYRKFGVRGRAGLMSLWVRGLYDT